MSEKQDNNSKNDTKNLQNEDIFGCLFNENPSAEDIFADTSCLENSKNSDKTFKSGKAMSVITISAICLTAIFVGFIGWFVYNIQNTVKNQINSTIPLITEKLAAIQPIPQPAQPTSSSEAATAEADFNEPVSWAVADELYKSKQFEKAYAALKKLKQSFETQLQPDEYFGDLLELKMGICKNYLNSTDSAKHFGVALASKSPIVNSIAHYCLASIELKSSRFMQARQNMYKALCLLDSFKNYIDAKFEADCYFMVCEAITREVLAINNRSADLVSNIWPDSTLIPDVFPNDITELRTLLAAGTSEIASSALTPTISSKEYVNDGIMYSALAVNAPFDEFINRLASTSQQNVVWKTGTVSSKSGINIYALDNMPSYITEIASGTAGLIARFDERSIFIFDGEHYESLDNQKELLSKEAISVWRRFLMRYETDKRAVNANFAWALMLECSGETDAAINHYTRTANKFSHSSIAPYSLLYSSNLRTKLRDYAGARSDLTQIIMQYNDSKITDMAYLNLAQSAMNSGLYDDAIKSFTTLYNTNISSDIRARAAEGIGICYYNKLDYKSADQWLVNCIHFENEIELDYSKIYFILGKVKANLGQHEQAAAALVNSLKSNLPTQEHIDIMIALSKAQAGQGKFVEALDTIENIDTTNLLQELVVEVLLAKSYILRSINLEENALSILRHQLAYIADADLRAQLSLELAMCYSNMGDYETARDELSDALKDLKPGQTAKNVNFKLADITLKLGNFDQAIGICSILLQAQPDEVMQKEIYELLGQAYTSKGDYELAAMAYSGKLQITGNQI